MDAIVNSSTPPPRAMSPSKASSKTRSLSDPPAASSTLAPSPTFRERLTDNESKDDHAVPITPNISRRPDFLARGLSLQMPPGTEMPSPSRFPRPVPLSPQLDQNSIHIQSPATSLPRHSRGLDFARACTNLHHSTLAEQSSPDSSPVIGQKVMMIPMRKFSMGSMMLEPPNMGFFGGMGDRSAMSSSVASVSMMASESESTDSDDDESMGGDENEDAILATPQVHKLQNPLIAMTPFATHSTTPGGGSLFSPAHSSVTKTIRRSRLAKSQRRIRKSSSSASGSGYSSMASPRTASPPPLRSIEGAAGGGYFNWPAAKSRRASLALGTDGLHLSSGNDSGDEASITNTPTTPGVVRRPVTRRGNLLPKTKGFMRIRASLAEEAAPIDTEVRREAETIRQVRDRDGSVGDLDMMSDSRPQTATTQSSPNLLPSVPECSRGDFGRDLDEGSKGLGMTFAAHASRNSGGLDYWNRFDPFTRTPPPNAVRQNSSILSDTTMDSEGGTPMWRRPRAQSTTSDASEAFAPSSGTAQPAAMNDDVHLKNFKRRREDDFDIATIKRRAVSPGMSSQNSPVLTHSPSQRDASSGWGQPPDRLRKESLPQSASSEVSQGSSLQPSNSQGPPQQLSRQGSGTSTISITSGSTAVGPTGGSGLPTQGKKLGLQKMMDTNDGLMKMSIE